MEIKVRNDDFFDNSKTIEIYNSYEPYYLYEMKRFYENNNIECIVALDTDLDVYLKHFYDSLCIIKIINLENQYLLDIGTGAGFPGLVLKLARPDIQMTFLDSTKKKLGFIENVLNECGVQGEILHMRAEEAAQLSKYREKFDFATARAVAALPVLSEYCLPFVKVGGSFVSMKSADSNEELNEAKKAISILGGKIEEDILFDLVDDMPRRIVRLKKNSQTPTKYPRPSAQISKKPLK